jgi:hypothetical protein
MADPTQYTFSHRELVEILIRNQGLHQGIWAASFQLGMGNTQVPSPSGGGDTLPAIVVTIFGVGLQKADKEGPSALDAAKVNPKKKK